METRQQNRPNEDDRRKTAVARVVQTPDRELPYKVVFTDENDVTTEHAFATIQESEAFIRQNTPAPATRSKLFDRKAGEA